MLIPHALPPSPIDEVVLYKISAPLISSNTGSGGVKRSMPSAHAGPIGPPQKTNTALTPASREFVPSPSVLFQLHTSSINTNINDPKPKPTSAPAPAPFLTRMDDDDSSVSHTADVFADLSLTTTAFSSSLATPQLTHSGSASSPRTTDSDSGDSPTKYAPTRGMSGVSACGAGIGLGMGGLTAADLSAGLLYSSHSLSSKLGLGLGQGGNDSPSDDFEMPVMRGSEGAFPLPFPTGPSVWPLGPQMPYSAAVGPRFPAPAPALPMSSAMATVSAGYASFFPAAASAGYPAAQAAYPVHVNPYSAYPAAPPPPQPYIPSAPAPLSHAGTQWLHEAMRHFTQMRPDGGMDSREALVEAERFLATIHQNNTQLVTYNTGTGAAWTTTQQIITPQHGAYMARAALPQLLLYGPTRVLRDGITRLPMPHVHLDSMSPGLGPMGVAPNNRKKDLYKTELCKNFEEKGECKYEDKCQFAHGHHELRMTPRHPKYKTEFCRTWYTEGTCPYAGRCCFIHPADTSTAYATGRMLPGPGSDPNFPRSSTSAHPNRGQSLLERIRNSSNDAHSEAYGARSQAGSSPVYTRGPGSPAGYMSHAGSGGSAYGNVSLPRVSSAGNITGLADGEDSFLPGHRMAGGSPGAASVASFSRANSMNTLAASAPSSPSHSDSSIRAELLGGGSGGGRQQQNENPNHSNNNNNPTQNHTSMPSPPASPLLINGPPGPSVSSSTGGFSLNLRLNTSLSNAFVGAGPQTAPVARASMSTASLFGQQTSPTIQRSNPLASAAAAPPLSPYQTTAGNPGRTPVYATLSDLRTLPAAGSGRPAMVHARTASYNNEAAPGIAHNGSGSGSGAGGGLALHIPRSADGSVPPAPLSASASSWALSFGTATAAVASSGERAW